MQEGFLEATFLSSLDSLVIIYLLQIHSGPKSGRKYYSEFLNSSMGTCENESLHDNLVNSINAAHWHLVVPTGHPRSGIERDIHSANGRLFRV